jgi:hypothetical protein
MRSCVSAGSAVAALSSSPPVSTVPPKSSCSSYFGGGVAVAMCSNEAAQGSRPLTITLHRPGARSGSAPGIAQAMGDALRDGERFEIGPTLDGADLLARFDILRDGRWRARCSASLRARKVRKSKPRSPFRAMTWTQISDLALAGDCQPRISTCRLAIR